MKIKNIEINYVQYGKENGKEIVLLHGWGGSIKTVDPVGMGLKNGFHITLVDLPGFGGSEEPSEAIGVYDYADILKELLIKLKINNPILFGHSFGGRIAIIYAAKNQVHKLILAGSPYKSTNKKPTIKVRILKILAKIPFLESISLKMKNKIGSEDYKNASPIMKQILVKAIHQDLTEHLKEISAPTLLFWGKVDKEVSLEDAKYAESIIPNAGLVIYENRGHYAYLEEINRTILVLREFLKKDR